MRVSIITVCKNECSTIANTIQSVLMQDYPDIEHIIIDGTSHDGTWEIIQSLRRPNTICLSEKDNNLYEAMNKGLLRSTGDIVYFLNGNDNLAHSGVISLIVNTFNQNPSAMIIQSKTSIIPPSTSKKFYRPLDKPFLRYQDAFVNLPPHQGLFVRRSAFERIGNFNTNIDVFADYDWFLRAWKKKLPVFFLNEFTAHCTPFGLSYKKRWSRWAQRLFIIWNNGNLFTFIYYLFYSMKRTIYKLPMLIRQ